MSWLPHNSYEAFVVSDVLNLLRRAVYIEAWQLWPTMKHLK